jgi:hypothetical protein
MKRSVETDEFLVQLWEEDKDDIAGKVHSTCKWLVGSPFRFLKFPLANCRS